MNQATLELFHSKSADDIATALEITLQSRNESPFWMDKVIPFSKAVLSILIPLREQKLLFDPQGKFQEDLTPELFLEWMDFVSLKMLAFTIQKSNEGNCLLRTSLSQEECSRYQAIDVTLLATYLSKYSVNMQDESLDFPIANYNVHQGVKNVVKSLL
jgi:hypothetical protein